MNFSVKKLIVGEPNQLNRSESIGEKERFSEYLIRKGVLSPKMIQQLQSEFSREPKNSFDQTIVDSKPKSNRRTKKRK